MQLGGFNFLQQVYETSGNCLSCGVTSCQETDKAFKDWASQAVVLQNGALKCTQSGRELQGQRPTDKGPASSYDYERNGGIENIRRPTQPTRGPGGSSYSSDEEGGARQVKNMDFNGAKDKTTPALLISLSLGLVLFSQIINASCS